MITRERRYAVHLAGESSEPIVVACEEATGAEPFAGLVEAANEYLRQRYGGAWSRHLGEIYIGTREWLFGKMPGKRERLALLLRSAHRQEAENGLHGLSPIIGIRL
jgi:hypothetical protein